MRDARELSKGGIAAQGKAKFEKREAKKVQLYVTELTDRSFLNVSGAERYSFLDSLLTRKISDDCMAEGKWTAAALLTPQGKLLDDFLIYATPEALVIDCAGSRRDELFKRLMMYKLRSQVEITTLSGTPFVVWTPSMTPDIAEPNNKDANATLPESHLDPRSPLLGARFVTEPDVENAAIKALAEWHHLRIQLAIPEGPTEMPPGSVFPLDYGLHLRNAISFDKGCFIGQEVTSRTYRRGTLKKAIFGVEISVNSGLDQVPHSLPAEITSDLGARGTLIAKNESEGFALLKRDVSDQELLTCGSFNIKLKTTT